MKLGARISNMNYFKEVREQFFSFFGERGHSVISASSLIPDDPSVLLTTAGMQQFKHYYTGELNPQKDFNSSRVASIQKCFRTSDIQEVGDSSHLTFFEMMGNFSFGPVGKDGLDNSSEGYFKESAIVWAYQFITERLGISSERIRVTIFGGDDDTPRDEESYRIWEKKVGMPKERISFGSRQDNFWGPTGSEGPCGPTAEIYVDNLEIWNLVFNEYYGSSKEGGGFSFKKLPNPGVDTGMGFERLLQVLEGKSDVFKTSSLSPIMDALFSLAPDISERSLRILADHIRGSVFLIADGIQPSNKEAGYILRRLLRRIIAIKIRENIHEDIFEKGYRVIRSQFVPFYPEIDKASEILEMWQEEFQKFQEAIARGLKEISGMKEISGKDAFRIYESFGLPLELIKELALAEATKNLFDDEFEREFKKHQDISRAGAAKKFGGHGLILNTGEIKAKNDEELARTIRLHTATHLLHWALRKLLGEEVRQMGSDINVERLRFDFNFDRKLEEGELHEIEKNINEIIQEDLPVYSQEMSKEEAQSIGALSFFKERYPDRVKIYFIGPAENGRIISKEFCGGPHVSSTIKIGNFRIIKEESIGKGVRRIKATVS